MRLTLTMRDLNGEFVHSARVVGRNVYFSGGSGECLLDGSPARTPWRAFRNACDDIRDNYQSHSFSVVVTGGNGQVLDTYYFHENEVRTESGEQLPVRPDFDSAFDWGMSHIYERFK